MAKLLRKSLKNHKAKFPNLSVFVGQKLILQHYFIQNVKNGVQTQVCTIDKETVTHLSQFILVELKKSLRKSQTQLREKLRNLRLRQDDSLEKKCL